MVLQSITSISGTISLKDCEARPAQQTCVDGQHGDKMFHCINKVKYDS